MTFLCLSVLIPQTLSDLLGNQLVSKNPVDLHESALNKRPREPTSRLTPHFGIC